MSGLSSTQAVIDEISLFRNSARLLIFFFSGKSRSTRPFSTLPVAILSIYVSGALKRFPSSATAITAIAPGRLLAAKLVPSKGSTAMSKLGPFLFPNNSPVYSSGASSSDPSPITTFPFMFILFNSNLIESTAA